MAASTKRKNRSKKRSRRRFRFNPFYVIVPVVVIMLIVGVWLLTSSGDSGDPGMVTAAVELPDWVRQGTSKAQQAYTQAVVHRDELRYIPCFCGCGPIGHQSVADCFVDKVSANGAVTYDTHGFT